MVNYSQLHSSIVISTNLLEFKDNYNGHQNMNTFKYKLLINTYHETLNLSSVRPFIPSTCIEINTINVGFFLYRIFIRIVDIFFNIQNQLVFSYNTYSSSKYNAFVHRCVNILYFHIH